MKPNFIIAVTGQSNSQGVGGSYDISKTEDQCHENVYGWNEKTENWEIANLYDDSLGPSDIKDHPHLDMFHRKPGMQSFAFHFAKQMAKTDPSKKIGIINYGIGAQEIKHWTRIPAQCMFRILKNLHDMSPCVIAIKACNDRILCVEDENSVHFSRYANINFGWESFVILDYQTQKAFNTTDLQNENLSNTKICIKSWYHNTFICVKNNVVTTTDQLNADCVLTLKILKIEHYCLYSFMTKQNEYLGLNTLNHVSGNVLGIDTEHCKFVPIVSTYYGTIYDTHVKRIHKAIKSAGLTKVDVICWHQGESDSDKYGTYYENALYSTIMQYRKEHFCNYKTPFIVGNTCVQLDSINDWWTGKNKQLYKLNVDNIPNTGCVNSVGVEYNINDPIHFSSEGHRQLGHLYLEKYKELINS